MTYTSSKNPDTPLIGHWEVYAGTNKLYWSDEVYRIHGLPIQKKVDIDAAINAYHPEDRDKVRFYVDRALNHKENYEFELRLIQPNGAVREVRSTGIVRLQDSGEVQSVFGVFQDITDEKRKTRELKEKTKMLEQAEHLGNIGHWVVRSDGTLYWSDEVYRIHGFEVGSEIDVEAAILAYHPDDRDLVNYYVKRAFSEKKDYHFELRLIRSDGELRNVFSTGVVSLGDDGEVDTLFGVFKDITEQKRTENRLKEAALKADAGNQAKSDFLASMSHELRTPLNAILGFGQILEMDNSPSLDRSQKNSVDYILKSGRHLLGLIDNILDLAKIESGKIDLFIETLSLKSILNECITIMSAKCEEQRLEIKLRQTSSATMNVLGDSTRIRQILLNLISNAIKYNTPEGRITLWVEETETHNLRILIEDTGKGIPSNKLDKVFEPFNRLGAETTNIEGTGIGLSLSRELALKMNGQLGFESEEGKGSTFWLDLPSAPKQNDSNFQSQAEDGNQNIVYYVEDNPTSVALMNRIVEQIPQVEFRSVQSAEQALSDFTQAQPNLILLDINLPGMDGFSALKAIKQNPEVSGIPVFAVTSAAGSEAAKRGAEVGFDRYFTKPINVIEVKDAIQKVFAEASRQSDN